MVIFRTINGGRAPMRGMEVIEGVFERGMDKGILPEPVSLAIKLVDTNWDRIVDLFVDLMEDPHKFLQEIEKNENLILLRSLGKSFLDLAEFSRSARKNKAVQ